MQRRLRSSPHRHKRNAPFLRDSKASYEKNLFAKFKIKYLDDNSVFSLYLCQFYDTGAMLQKSVTLTNDINRLVCGHLLHLDLHCLQTCLSQYDVAWVNFCLFIYLKLCRRNFYHLLFFLCFNCK